RSRRAGNGHGLRRRPVAVVEFRRDRDPVLADLHDVIAPQRAPLLLDRRAVDAYAATTGQRLDEDARIERLDGGVAPGDAPALQDHQVVIAAADAALVVQAPYRARFRVLRFNQNVEHGRLFEDVGADPLLELLKQAVALLDAVDVRLVVRGHDPRRHEHDQVGPAGAEFIGTEQPP